MSIQAPAPVRQIQAFRLARRAVRKTALLSKKSGIKPPPEQLQQFLPYKNLPAEIKIMVLDAYLPRGGRILNIETPGVFATFTTPPGSGQNGKYTHPFCKV